MPDALNWDEFRLVRAIAETRSLYGAAARLGLNHSTMFRRLTALETRLGLKLFERDRSGYRPTGAGEDMVALATLMGDTIAEFERRVGGQNPQLTGRVRLTTFATLAFLVAPRIVARFCAAYPALQVDLQISRAPTDLMGGDSDVALRLQSLPPPEELAAKRVAACPWAIYASPELIPPGAEDRLAGAPWLAPLDGYGPPQAHRWLARHIDAARVTARAGSLLALAALAGLGAGATLLPCFVGAATRGLRKVGDAEDDICGDFWVVAAPAALRKARVRALYDHLVAEFEQGAFEGEANP